MIVQAGLYCVKFLPWPHLHLQGWIVTGDRPTGPHDRPLKNDPLKNLAAGNRCRDTCQLPFNLERSKLLELTTKNARARGSGA